MNYQNYYKVLFALTSFSGAYERTQKIIKKLVGQVPFKVFHVVGTNGKSSVASFLAQGFSQKFKVGLFVSPHLMRVNERIRVNNVCVSDADLFKITKKILREGRLPFFHLMYVASLLYFKNQKADFVVMEAGIGGLNDVTRLVGGQYGVITSVGKDHTEILGNTLTKITLDKAGIMQKNMLFFLPLTIPFFLRKIILSTAKREIVQVQKIKNHALDFSTQNQILCTKILEHFGIFTHTFTPLLGRCTPVQINQTTHVVDVSHNYAGIKATLAYLKANRTPFQQIVLSVAKTKDIKRLPRLFGPTPVFVYQNYSSTARKLQNYRFGTKIFLLSSFLKKVSKPTLFVGSFRLAEEIFHTLKKLAKKDHATKNTKFKTLV